MEALLAQHWGRLVKESKQIESLNLFGPVFVVNGRCEYDLVDNI
jgi:hypothetical protein